MREVTVKRSEWLRGDNRAIRNRLAETYVNAHGHGMREAQSIGTTLCETFLADNDPNCAVTGRCCLGFWANSIGFSDDELSHQGTPHDLAASHCPTYTELQTLTEQDKELLDSLANWDGDPVRTWDCFDNDCAPNSNFSQMMRINDDPTINDAEREAHLITMGAREDIEFTFVD